MGQLLHGSAKTTHAIRGELQRSQASSASLAKRHGINEKTVLKWRHRRSVEDMPMGAKERRSTVLSPMEEAVIVALRYPAVNSTPPAIYQLLLGGRRMPVVWSGA